MTELLRLLSDGKSHGRSEILHAMKKPQNYSVYRDRLIKKGLIEQKRGAVEVMLPYFGEYVRNYDAYY